MFFNRPYCRICRRREPSVLQDRSLEVRRIWVCAVCAVRAGSFFLDASDEAIRHFWKVEEKQTAAQPARSVPAVRDLQTHLDLGTAYMEMGHLREALEEAGAVLATDPPEQMKIAALKILFAKPVLTVHLLRIGDAVFEQRGRFEFSHQQEQDGRATHDGRPRSASSLHFSSPMAGDIRS